MNPTTEETTPQVQIAAEHLETALTQPLPTTTLPQASSIPSERDAVLSLMELLTRRVEQVARASAEQWGRVDQVLEQMIATMRLAQVMIAEQDRQQREGQEQLNRMEAIMAAQIKINANLSQIVAALLDNNQKD